MQTNTQPEHLLAASPLLDFTHPDIERLIAQRNWRALDPYDRIGAIYDFVRNEIVFGYNASDDVPASEVLRDGHGQCNTKSTLFMALLRGAGVSCRFHGFTIDKPLQKGALTGLAYWLAPQRIIHSWVEVWLDGCWIALEGLILDEAYLRQLQRKFSGATQFCGYGAATPNLMQPSVQWRGLPTFIQKDGIAEDFGLYDTPDAFYAQRGANLSGLKRWVFVQVLRPRINAHVQRLRQGETAIGPAPETAQER